MSLFSLASNELAHGAGHGCFFGACGGQGLSVGAHTLLHTLISNDHQHTAMQFQRDPQEVAAQLGNQAVQRDRGSDGIVS